jgi:hypothetical protein
MEKGLSSILFPLPNSLLSLSLPQHIVRDYTADHGKLFNRDQRREILRWSLITLTGFLCAIFGIGIHMATITLVDFKNEIVTSYLDNGKWLHAFTWHCAMGLIFCSLSFYFVYLDPGALGSGVPEVKRLSPPLCLCLLFPLY